MDDTWEIHFNLLAEGKNKSESFHFKVNPLKDPSNEFPSFPKEKMLRALKEHGDNNKYGFAQGRLRNLKLKKKPTISKNDEIHILMIVFEKIGPISLVFINRFEYLVLEGIDAQYNYIGYKTLVNLVLQSIKPDSEPIRGLGRITRVYHTSNAEELIRKRSYSPIFDTAEGNIAAFIASFLLPTLFIIILPLELLDSTWIYILVLGVLSILVSSYSILKRSSRYAPLSLVSLIISYVLIESMIHVNILTQGINPWGIFNNISRNNLVGILRNQPIIDAIAPQIVIGIDLLATIIPFMDLILLSLLPFTISPGISGLTERVEKKLSMRNFVRKSFFGALFLISIILLPMSYHAIGKGMEGTLYASIGVSETSEIFSEEYLTNIDTNLDALLTLINSAQFNLNKAGNSFQHFADNPLIAYVLPYFIPNLAGIPLEDLSKILNLTYVLSNSLEYIPNLLWAISNLESGVNLTFTILQQSIENPTTAGVGSEISSSYDTNMKTALNLILLGTNNLTSIQNSLLTLFSQAKDKLDYSVFAEISTIITDFELSFPILVTILENLAPWINSTYKLTLVLDDLFDYEFNSPYLQSALVDFENSTMLSDIDVDALPLNSTIPIRDLASFSQNLHSVTKYFLYTVQNGSMMFQQLNSTLKLFEDIDFSNSSHINDPIWGNINTGLTNTSNLLNNTQSNLENMGDVLSNQDDFEFTELNAFVTDLQLFIDNTSQQFDVVNTYFDVLDGTFNAISSFSTGVNVFNDTLTQDLVNSSVDYTEARDNFTLSQFTANQTASILTSINYHLLNQSSIDNWIELLNGSSNSIWLNAGDFVQLITDIEAEPSGFILLSHLNQLDLILNRAEALDWNIFS
ncbi:MAG: hypothetical protein ACXABI_15970 [Candidatus Hodarchaeales archaeon]|jgi:hypothetical protein